MYADQRCGFFQKMGACRHGDGCTKVHQRPTLGPTVLFPLMYPNPLAVEHITDRAWSFEFDKKYLKKHFEHFYKDVWRTFMEFGRISELRVVGNLCDHLLGNVYIKFEDPQAAAKVVDELKLKKFNDILLLPELSPVTDFGDACCKEDREGECKRGAQCNFLHILKVSRSVMEKLEKEQNKYWKKRDDKKDKRRSRSRDNRKERSVSPPGKRARREGSPGPLCHICGRTGHISRDCPMKVTGAQ